MSDPTWLEVRSFDIRGQCVAIGVTLSTAVEQLLEFHQRWWPGSPLSHTAVHTTPLSDVTEAFVSERYLFRGRLLAPGATKGLE